MLATYISRAALSRMVSLLTVTVPERPWNMTPLSEDSLPLPVTVEFVREKPVTPLPLIPIWPEFVTDKLSNVTPVIVCKNRFATQERLLPPIRSPPQLADAPGTVCAVPLPVRFMFLSVTAPVVMNSAPLPVLLWIDPPLPAVVPGPVTV